MRSPITATLTVVTTIAALGLLAGCQSARITGQREYAPAVQPRPAVIYVADFELGVANIQHEPGRLSSLPGPAANVGGRLEGSTDDPQARARKLVDLMSNSLVKDLTEAGFIASRLMPGRPLPAQGWLVHGIFVQVQEGNRVKRAMVGLGSGQTDVQVVVGVDSLSQGAPKPLYEVDTEASSGKGPGAAPTLVLGPYGAAVRFVAAGKDVEKNVKQTARQIAANVAQRVAGPEKQL